MVGWEGWLCTLPVLAVVCFRFYAVVYVGAKLVRDVPLAGESPQALQ